MTVTLTRSAWTGLLRHLDDASIALTVENIPLLAGPRSPSITATIDPETLSAVVVAYRLWSTSLHLRCR